MFNTILFVYFLSNSILSNADNATKSIECYGNPDMLVNITCRLKPISWEKTVATMDSDLVGNISNATLNFQVFKYTNQFRPFLINVTVNLCQMLQNGKGNSYGKWMLKFMTYHTSINHNCPYSGHLAAYGVYLDSKFIPFGIPIATYKMKFVFSEGWPLVHIGTVEAIANVIEANAMRRKTPKGRTQAPN